MPLAGFRCPSFVPTAGEAHTLDHCLTKCPHQCAAPPLLAAIWKESQTNHHVGAYISASMLAGSACPRQTVYERKYTFHEVPLRRFWPFRGTHAHSIIEGAGDVLAPLGWIQEYRMTADFVYEDHAAPIFDKAGNFTGRYNKRKPLVITVGGTCDCYNPIRRELWDMKSMKDEKTTNMITGEKPRYYKNDTDNNYSKNLKDSWVVQLNIYGLLISKTKVPQEIKDKLAFSEDYFPAPTTLGIQGISMAEIPRSGGSYEYRKRAYEIDSVPVWPLEQTEAYVRREALKWYKWLVLEEPTPVVDEQNAWLCKSCPFNAERVAGGQCNPAAERAQWVEIKLD